MNEYEIIKFKVDDIELDVSISLNEETIWLTKERIGKLFGRDRTVISRHINNIYKEEELDKNPLCIFLHISNKGKNPDYRPPEYYNLEVVLLKLLKDFMIDSLL